MSSETEKFFDQLANDAKQTLEDVLHGAEPNEAFLQEFRELEEAPAVSDDELERQALLAPGDDGNPATPE